MKLDLVVWQFVRVMAVIAVALAITLALIHSRRDEETRNLPPVARGKPAILVSELARCRSIAPDAAEVLESCRGVWAENREHFFEAGEGRAANGRGHSAMTISGNRVTAQAGGR